MSGNGGFAVERLRIAGLYGRSDLDLAFVPGVNVFYGRNGSGKTTALHVLANLLNGALDRFAYLDFRSVDLTLADGRNVSVVRSDEPPDKAKIHVSVDGQHFAVYRVNAVVDYERTTESGAVNNPYLSSLAPAADPVQYQRVIEDGRRLAQQLAGAAYFPAFRMMVEAWRAAIDRTPGTWEMYLESGRYAARPSTQLTRLARDLFGQFVPAIDYPSVVDVAEELQSEVRFAEGATARYGQRILSDAFVRAFASLAKPEGSLVGPHDEILESIEGLVQRLDDSEIVEHPEARREDPYRQLRNAIPSFDSSEYSDIAFRVLSVYRDALQSQVALQGTAFAPLKRLIASVNEFLEGKDLVVAEGSRAGEVEVSIEFDAGGRQPLRWLSSGERQVVSMLYAASQVNRSDTEVVLIDEPELSLHVDWQRILIARLAAELGERQLVVCTHSPEIGAEFEDRFWEVRSIPTVASRR